MQDTDEVVIADLHTTNTPTVDLKWSNDDNNIFYESLKAEGLQVFADKAGLSSGSDMLTLKPHWSKAESILEVGTGYGRVIDYLVTNNYQGNVTAIERCGVLFNFLNKKMNSRHNINLIKTDLRNLEGYPEHFDLILYLWSGIADFPRLEQAGIIRKLAKLLQPGGKLVLDTLSMDLFPIDVEKMDKQLYSLKINNQYKYIYEPNNQEIATYARLAGLTNIEQIRYKTDTCRERWMYLLS